jgi:ribonuclease HIII
MTQRTEVFRFPAARAEELRRALAEAGFEERSLAHAFFQARGEGVIASLYRSGKLVVQGKGVDGFAARFLDGAMPTPGKEKKQPSEASAAGLQALAPNRMGSDEAGKGDSFGGLTVAAVALPEDRVGELEQAGVTDSKAVADQRIRVLAPWIRDNFACVERVLSPSAYNLAHREAGGNVNTLLTRLHIEVLSELHASTGYSAAVVDRFSPREPVRTGLKAVVPELVVVEMPRAEAVAAVAAASVLAREAFLVQMEALAEQWACRIPLGSGAPVPPALRGFLKLHGREQLNQVVKMHFANVKRITEELPWN